MAFNYIAKGTKAEDTTGASVSPTYMGSINANDILIIKAINVQGSVGNISTPSGYTSLGEEVFSWGTAATFIKFATGSESGTESVSRSGSSNTYMMANIYQWRADGGLLATLEDSDPRSDTTSSATWDAITVAGAARLLIASIIDFDGGGTPDAPTGYSNVDIDTSSLISGTTFRIFQKTNQSSDGSVSNSTASSNGWATWHLSLFIPIAGRVFVVN